MKSLTLVLVALFCSFLLIEAKKVPKEVNLPRQTQQLFSQMFDSITRGDLRREGQAISKRKLAWLKTEDLMKLPLMKLHSIPAQSWTGLTSKQASKLTASFISRLSQEQAKFIPARAVKSMSEGTKRAHARLINQPPIWFRLTSMVAAGSLALVLYRYTGRPMKPIKHK